MFITQKMNWPGLGSTSAAESHFKFVHIYLSAGTDSGINTGPMSSPSLLSWNHDLGMCRQEGPGHTAGVADRTHVHSGVSTATQLCWWALRGELDEKTMLAALGSLRAMQVKATGARRGCLRWYWEETETADTNAAFFIGLALQLLCLVEGERLSGPVRALICAIVTDLDLWFDHELDAAHPRYPNKCMGDLVCGWLAAEILQRAPSTKLVRTTLAWCAYWRRENWGWGEHLSDTYTMVLLTELSAVLLFCPRLPAAVRAELKAHFDALLVIEDSFGDGPRVPAIRSYAFTETPPFQPFRSFIKAQAPGLDEPGIEHPAVAVRVQAEVFGVWFHRAGWEKLASRRSPVRPWIEIPCHDGTVAKAIVRPGLRLGAMSRYPVMDGVEHPTWGLSWQSFPVALWRPAGDWAFWRWVTRSGERVRGHPALDKASAYLGNALAARLDPPPVPRMTSTLTPDGWLEQERVLPVPPGADWDEVSDEFCLIGSAAVVKPADRELTLCWPDATVVVRWQGAGVPVWESHERGGRWVVRYNRSALLGRHEITHSWRVEVTPESSIRP
jgi:hypothetical protein